MNDLTRRNLLGLMAAAPVAAVAKPVESIDYLGKRAPVKITFSHVPLETFEFEFDGVFHGRGGGGGGALFPASGETVDIFIPDHPPGGLLRLADDEGPGAPAKVRAAPPDPQARTIPSGASVPDDENPILKHARAC